VVEIVAAVVCVVAVGAGAVFAIHQKNKVFACLHSRLPAGFHDCCVFDCLIW